MKHKNESFTVRSIKVQNSEFLFHVDLVFILCKFVRWWMLVGERVQVVTAVHTLPCSLLETDSHPDSTDFWQMYDSRCALHFHPQRELHWPQIRY